MVDATETMPSPYDAALAALRAELVRVTAERDWLRDALAVGLDKPRSAA